MQSENNNINWDNIDFSNINFNDISDEDLKELGLLSKQFVGTILYLIASIIQVKVTDIAMNNILDKPSKDSRADSDILAIEFQLLFVISRIMFILVELSRIDNLKDSLLQGNMNFSLKPNYQIALGNIIALIGDSLELLGFVGIYKRNQGTPFI